MESYDTDGFKTLTLRVDRQTRTAQPEGLTSLYLYDSLTIVVSGVYSVDPDNLVFGVYSEAGDLISETGSWAFVPGRKDAVYALVSLATANAETLASGLTPGTPVTVWLSMLETGGRTVLDTSLPFYRSLSATGGGSAGEISVYATSAALKAIAQAVQAMPADTPFNRQKQMEALLSRLAALST